MSRRKARKMPKHTKPASGFDPRYLKHEVLLATAALVICLFVGAGVVERYIKETGSPFVAAVIAAVLVDLANQDRTSHALPELRVNPVLAAAAQAKANDMAAKGYFSHTSPEGYDSWHWFRLVGYEYQYAGENLAVDFSDSGDVQRAWMNSPTHRDNIVNARYTEIGIAVATGTYQGRPTVFAVQMFGAPRAETASRAPVAPQPAATQAAAAPTSVLGESTIEEEPVGALAEQDLPAQAGGDAAVILSTEEIPWWGFLVALPKQTLQYAYYLIGLLILAALFFDVRWELRKHHIRHATKAGVLLATMSMLFVVADWVFFAEPILAALGIG